MLKYFSVCILLCVQVRALILITVLYPESNLDRVQEYKTCIDNNLKIKDIDTIHVLYDNSVLKQGDQFRLDIWLISKGIKLTYIKGRPTFNFIFEFANNHYPQQRIIVSNADIYFDLSLETLRDYDLTNKFLALTRWDVVPSTSKNSVSIKPFVQYYNGQCTSDYSQDAWIFMTPIRTFNDITIKIGEWGCDSELAYQAVQSGLEVTNPCLSIHAIHLHLTSTRNYKRIDSGRPSQRTPWTILI